MSLTDAGSAPMSTLTAGQAVALDNLARKQAGQEVGWINISAAQALTGLGLARRSAEGWSITAEGVLALADHPPLAAETIPLPPRRLRPVDRS